MPTPGGTYGGIGGGGGSAQSAYPPAAHSRLDGEDSSPDAGSGRLSLCCTRTAGKQTGKQTASCGCDDGGSPSLGDSSPLSGGGTQTSS